MCVMMANINCLAAETIQGGSWYQEENVWKAKDANENQVVNAWYQEADGSRYFIDANGIMQSGLLNDNGHFYYLQTEVEGYGKMIIVDGVYHGVELKFNQDISSEFYGEILSGSQELINTGINLVSLDNTQQQQSQVKTTNKYVRVNPGYVDTTPVPSGGGVDRGEITCEMSERAHELGEEISKNLQ